jgi:acyl-homoserine lactone acylase PvdQ
MKRKFHPTIAVFALAVLSIFGIPHRNGQQTTGERVTRKRVSPSTAVRKETAAQLASSVTIYRDTYGVPHVFGRTDASTMFGFAYAQAEDNFWRVEENFIAALGRGAELHGEEALNEDRPARARSMPALIRKCGRSVMALPPASTTTLLVTQK